MSAVKPNQVDLYTARIIARMLFPERDLGDLSLSNLVIYAELVAACRENKIPLLSLNTQDAPFAGFYASESFRTARAQEQALWAAQRDEYLQVHEALAQAGIQDVLIKSAGIAPSLPYRSDNLDVLVPLAQGNRARELLLALGYHEVKNVEEPHKFLFRKFHAGVSISAIHLHEFVGWGTGFMEDAGVLARARRAPDDPALWIPAPEDSLLITMAHAFYEDKAVKLADLWKVVYLLWRGGLDWDAMYRQVDRRGWRDGLDTCVCLWSELERALYGRHSFPQEIVQQAQQQMPDYSRTYLRQRFGAEMPSVPFKLSFAFSKRHYYQKVYRDQMLTPREKFVDALRHSLAGIKRRLPKSQCAMLVSLSGIDGCGKTAQAELLCRAFQECEVEAMVVWSRGGSSRLADAVIGLVKPWLKREAGGDVTSDTRAAKVERKTAWLQRPLLRKGWTALVVLDLLLRYWARVSWPLLRGRVVITDRYYYDALVELAALSGAGPEVARARAAKLLKALSPRPRLAYWLDVAPEVAQARKADELHTFLAQQAQLYRALAPAWGLKSVDAHGDLAAINDRLLDEIFREYYRNWHTLVGSLFLANPMKRA